MELCKQYWVDHWLMVEFHKMVCLASNNLYLLPTINTWIAKKTYYEIQENLLPRVFCESPIRSYTDMRMAKLPELHASLNY